jgi:elongation factor P
MEDCSQYRLSGDDLEVQVDYLTKGLEGITTLLMYGEIIGIELPQSVNMKVADTSPVSNGATASGRTRPATLMIGLYVQVPQYLENGEIIKINTSNGKFISRA